MHVHDELALHPATVVEIDLALLGGLVDDTHEGGHVEFSVKELLVDISKKIDDQGAAHRSDLAAAEVRLSTRFTEQVTSLRFDTVPRIVALEAATQQFRIQWAKLIGIGLGIAAVSGGLTAGVVNALSK